MIENNKEVVTKLLNRLEITLKGEEKELTGKDLMKCVMPKFLPFGKTLLQMMVTHLPSPITAQQYRVETLYTGPLDDECATAIKNWYFLPLSLSLSLSRSVSLTHSPNN